MNSSTEIVCRIRPTAAEVFVANAVCKIGEGVNATKPKPRLEMRLSAVAKYPYIVASEHAISFGEVIVNCNDDFQCKREFVVRNQSVVPAAFKILRREQDRDPVFSIEPSEGLIPPGSEINFTVRYTPMVAGTYTEENFKIVTPGGNKENIKLSGRCVAPVVVIHKKADPFAKAEGIANSLNFRDAHVGETVSRVLFLRNDSELPAAFCFNADDTGIFKFDRTRGVIPPHFETSVLLRFSPQKPGNFYRRIFCLIENAQPQFIDCMGSGYIDAKGEIKEQRPAPLRHAHVQAFKNRAAAGLGRIGPAELEDMYKVNKMSKLFAGVGPEGTQALATSVAARPVTRAGDTTRNEVAVAHELFVDFTDRRSEIVLSTREVDFGYNKCDGRKSQAQEITMTNNCKEKVTVNWFIPSPDDGDSQKDFVVYPPISDIMPKQSVSFKVYFSPSAQNFYYCQDLEAVVFFKSQRSFRLVTDATLQPPWNVALRAVGHSFDFEQFLPKIAISLPQNKLAFPSTFVGDSSYQTIMIKNMGNLPAQFQFLPDRDGVFAAKPWGGLIPAEDFQLVTIRFTPKSEKKYKDFLECVLNNTPSMAERISVIGEGSVPKIVVENTTKSGSLYMKPTCVGLASTRKLVVYNPTRVPLVFRASLPHKLDGTVLDISPRSAKLQGNERCELTVTFAPRTEKTYRCKMHVKVRPLAGPSPDLRDARQIGQAENAPIIQSVGVTLVCPGGVGAVSFDPPQLDFGVKLVNYSEQREFRLVNGSDCDLKYQILHHLISGPEGSDPRLLGMHIPLKSKPNPSGNTLMMMDKPSGVLPARSKLRTHVTFSPYNHGDYKFEMICKVARVDENGFEKMVSPEAGELLRKNEDALLDAGYDGDGASYYADLPGVEEKKAEPSFESIMPLKINLLGSASFPFLVFRDVRVDKGGFGMGCSTDQIFGQLGLEKINKTLATPLTKSEVEYNLLSSPDLSLLPTFDFPFTPAPVKSETQVMYLELRNPEFLPVKWSIHLPNEKDIELETWADEGEPSAAEIKITRIIDELKCFEVYPREGELESGESMTLKISYSYDSLEYGGKHELPLLLRVYQGKQFWINCVGQTLTKTQSCVVPRTVNSLTQLHPVAVGTRPHEAPLQETELMNVSNVTVDYKLDMKSIDKFNDQFGYGLKLLQLENPSGTIDKLHSVLLRWRFFPLESKMYEFEIPYKIITGKSKVKGVLKFSAKGYDPRDWSIDPHRMPPPSIESGHCPPPDQCLPVATQVASLSIDRLKFGRLPQRSSTTKLSIIKNLSDRSIKFTVNDPYWKSDNVNDDSDDVLQVYPIHGVIEPGKQQLLKMTVNASGYPRVLDKTVPVELMEIPRETTGMKVKTKEDKDSERVLEMSKKVGDSFHPSVTLGNTLSGVGSKLNSLLEKASKLPRNQNEARQVILNKAYLLLTELGTKNHVTESFIETVIMKLIKVGLKEDLDELALEGGHEPRSLDVLMDELDYSYRRKWREPEIQLAFMLYGLADEDLPTPTKPKKNGSTMNNASLGSLEGKVSFGSMDDTAGSATDPLPTTGMRGTMVMSRGANKKKSLEVTARAPEKSYIFLHVRGEIVEEEPFFFLYDEKLVGGKRIPPKREFISNPMEQTPANLVKSTDDFVDGKGSEGACGGAKEAAAVKGLLTTMLSELVESNDLIDQLGELPKEPRQPYLGEVQRKPPLMTSLQAAFDLFDVDASGTLTNEEVGSALRHLGMSHKDAKVKHFLKELDKNGDNEVDMREFLQGLTPEMAHKIADALETNEDMIVAMRAERQKLMERMAQGHNLSPKNSPRTQRTASQANIMLLENRLEEKVEVDTETHEENSAATMLQKRARVRMAQKKVQNKRFLATAEGAEMNSAALMIQGKARQRKARQEMRRQAAIKKKHKLNEASQNEELRDFVPRIMEESLFNLLREAMETPLNDIAVVNLEDKLKTLMEQVDDHPDIENEILLAEDEKERIGMLPRFDLNLKPKTFVRNVEE